MHAGLVLAKLVVVALGLLISFQVVRAYGREEGQRMLLVAGGFCLLAVGSVLESVLYDVAGLSVFLAGMVQTAFVAAGMLFLLYSLLGTERGSPSHSTVGNREV